MPDWFSEIAGPIATIITVFAAGVFFGLIAAVIIAKIFTKDFIDSLVTQRLMKMHKDSSKGKSVTAPAPKKKEKVVKEKPKKEDKVTEIQPMQIYRYSCLCEQTQSQYKDKNLTCPICNTKVIYPINKD